MSSEMRDWVRSVQLFEKAMRLMEGVGAEAETKVEFYGQFAGMRLRTEGWRLQSLTDLTKLPDYEEDGAVHFGRRGMPWGGGGDERGAPVDEKGEPVLHRVPESWEKAATDGERFRWLLAQMAKQSPSAAVRADEIFMTFLAGEFDVQTMASYWRAPEDEEGRQDGILSLHTLKEHETVARLATGVKRFMLPEEFSYVGLAGRIFRNGRRRWWRRMRRCSGTGGSMRRRRRFTGRRWSG